MNRTLGAWALAAASLIFALGADRAIPDTPAVGIFCIALALILAAYGVVWSLFKVNPFTTRTFYAIAIITVIAYVAVVRNLIDLISIESISSDIAYSKLSKYAGQVSPYGRKEALEYLSNRKKDLTKTNISNASIPRLNLSPGTNWGEAVFVNARVPNSSFRDAHMSGSLFSAAILNGSDFRGADLSGSIFGAHLLYGQRGNRRVTICYEGARLRNVNFFNANLGKAYLYGATGLKCSQLKAALHWETTFRDKNLSCGKPIPPPPKYIKRPFKTCEELRNLVQEK